MIDFDCPLRRKFPISQPSILKRLQPYNRTRSYDFRIKPFGFVQSVSEATKAGSKDVLPIAPFERDLAKSKRLQWVDFNTGDPVALDWHGSHLGGTIPVMRLNEYVEQYHRHPEAKAADQYGNPAGPYTVGLLGRLMVRSAPVRRIGKEIDRIDEDDGASLEPNTPIEYERDELADDIAYLATFPQESAARDLGITTRRWREIVKGRSKPRETTAQRIQEVAARLRCGLPAPAGLSSQPPKRLQAP